MARAWRRRSRRAQVSAVATILGLLLVVIMIANYLGTQLPAQMRVNDANRALSVEDQLVRLAASLQVAAASGAMGAPLSQPVSLGSVGSPPFAAPDPASIGPGAVGSLLTAAFTVIGPTLYQPPGGWPAGGNLFSSGCSFSPAGSENPTTVSCGGGVTLTQNFTNGSHFISVTGGANLHLNFTASYSTIDVTTKGGPLNTVEVVGDHDLIYLNATGGSTVQMTLVGSYDNLSASGQGNSNVGVYLVGNYDYVSWSANGASSHFLERAWGSYDTTSDTNSNAAVYYTAFNATSPTSSVCPYGNASSTDGVSGSGGTVSYNNTNYGGSGTQGSWTATWNQVSNQQCPFFRQVVVPQGSSGAVGATMVVHLRNTYGPSADVAFDQGAVIYAQAGGSPLMLVGPGLNYSQGTLSLWVPEFVGQVGTEVGVGTAEVSARLVSVLSLTLPSNGFRLGGSTVAVNVTTAYWGTWTTYLNSYFNNTGLHGVASVGCKLLVSSGSNACKGSYAFNGPLASVTVSLPVSALSGLELTVATYSIVLG